MREHADVQELRTKLAKLEGNFRRLDRRRRIWRWAAFATMALGVTISLAAQSSQGPVTLQSLAKRVTDLENRVAADEASGTNIPPTADTTPASGTKKSSSSSSAATASSADVAALDKRVTALEGDVQSLMDMGIQERFVNDELKLSQLNKSLAQLQSQLSALKSASASGQGGSGTSTSRAFASTITAPLRIVNSAGKVLLSVQDDVTGASLRLFNGSGKDVVALQSIQDEGSAVFTDGAGDKTVTTGVLFGQASVESAEGKEYVVLGRPPGETNSSMGVHVVGSSGIDLISLEDQEGKGSLLIRKDKTIVGVFAANQSNEGATLSTYGNGASNALEAGIDPDSGEPTLSIFSKKGARAKIGANTAGSMGVRIFSSGSAKQPIATMADQLNGTGSILVTDGKTPLAGMGVDQNGKGRIGVTNGKFWLGEITGNDNGAEVYISNSTGQKVAGITADPTSNAGEVLVYDSGGTPLGLMSVQGNHGDVQLNSSDKQVDVWKFLLLPH